MNVDRPDLPVRELQAAEADAIDNRETRRDSITERIAALTRRGMALARVPGRSDEIVVARHIAPAPLEVRADWLAAERRARQHSFARARAERRRRKHSRARNR
jgi:hypothetical protein